MKNIEKIRIYVLAEDFAGYSSRFWAQHGISFFIEMFRENKKNTILFDTGTHHTPVLFNAHLLNLNMKDVEYIVLSHSHYDHTGGLPGVIKEINKEVEIIAHPQIFKESYAMDREPRYIGPPANMRESVEEYGGKWLLSREPVEIMSGVWTLGEISQKDRVEYEIIKETKVFMKEGDSLVPDYLEDEIGMVIITTKGLVVIGGCSHPGIVGMVKRAMEITGMRDILAVIGGFHLVNATDNRIKRTVEDLKKMNVKDIYTGHCTGLQAECEFSKNYGKNFHKLHAGMLIEL